MSTTFGATVMPTSQAPSYQHITQPRLDSPILTPAVSNDGSAPSTPNPKLHIPISSPFYEHPPASHERLATSSNKENYNSLITEKDLESGTHTPHTPSQDRNNPFSSKISVDCHAKECTMWPSRQTLVQKQKTQKKESRSGTLCAPIYNFWSRFDKRQKLFIKIGIALFLIGVAVAIAVGITVAVHGSVYSASGGSHPIPQ